MATASSRGLSSVLAGGADTIVACATPRGRGALALIRISGADAAAVTGRVCPTVRFANGRVATLAEVRGSDGQPLERAVVVPYPAPRSYTGEDMLEITVHASPYLIETVIAAFVTAGARPAEPGEFTRRAVANGKFDLLQAEAIRDLTAAATARPHENAWRHLLGALSEPMADLRASLIDLLATVEASLDYEAQGVEVPPGEIDSRMAGCRERIERLLRTARAGERIRDGARVVILGRPNAGKSTLFNLLCGRERAIVSPHPGTTRDLIEAELDIAGVRTILVDSAGLRTAGDPVEAEAHRRAVAAAEAADVVILLWAADEKAHGAPPESPGSARVIRVASKADLAEANDRTPGWLWVSCRSGEGVDDLQRRLARMIEGEIPDLGGAVAIASRHRRLLEKAAAELDGFDPAYPELAAEKARQAVQAVAGLIGEVDSEEVLDAIFDGFCIGK